MREREREARGVGIATAREGRKATDDRLTATHDGRFLAGVNSIRDSSKKGERKERRAAMARLKNEMWTEG